MIKLDDPSSSSKRYAKYIPFWAWLIWKQKPISEGFIVNHYIVIGCNLHARALIDVCHDSSVRFGAFMGHVSDIYQT